MGKLRNEVSDQHSMISILVFDELKDAVSCAWHWLGKEFDNETIRTNKLSFYEFVYLTLKMGKKKIFVQLFYGSNFYGAKSLLPSQCRHTYLMHPYTQQVLLLIL